MSPEVVSRRLWQPAAALLQPTGTNEIREAPLLITSAHAMALLDGNHTLNETLPPVYLPAVPPPPPPPAEQEMPILYTEYKNQIELGIIVLVIMAMCFCFLAAPRGVVFGSLNNAPEAHTSMAKAKGSTATR